jgi:hypothetical protein
MFETLLDRSRVLLVEVEMDVGIDRMDLKTTEGENSKTLLCQKPQSVVQRDSKE